MALGNWNNWFKIAAALKPAAAEVVRDEAFFIADAIKAQIVANGQVSQPIEGYPGGFMHDSIYASTVNESTYGQGIEPPKGAYRLPEEKPDSDQQGTFGCAANYGIFQNDGTRYLPARPFFEPGMERGAAQFDVYMPTMEGRINARI